MSVIKVNNITNRDGTSGPVIAGIVTVSSSSHFVVPTGRTGQRYADGGENIVRDGLVLYLDAKYSYPGATGTNPDVYTWYDMSGNENHGELKNGVGYNAANGGSLTFDGSNDYGSIQHSSTLSFATALTISVWFYSNTTPTAILYLKGRTDADNYNPALNADGEYAWTGPNGRSRYLPSAGYTVSNTWYNLTVSHTSGSNPVIYRNAVASTSHTYSEGNGTYALGTNSNPVGINADIPRGTIFSFNGRITLLQAYNRALSAAEVSQNFDATRSRYGI